MTEKYCEERLQVRCPTRLIKAVDIEARRRMLSRSGLVRSVLARELGLSGDSASRRRDSRSE